MISANGPIEVTDLPRGVGLQVRTPGQFAMGVAVEILEFFDKRPGISVKNTGWKQGFGLEVAAWVPIRTLNVVAELQTDGDLVEIRLASGPIGDFGGLLAELRDFLGGPGGDL